MSPPLLPQSRGSGWEEELTQINTNIHSSIEPNGTGCQKL